MKSKRAAVILAAGKGKRMKSDLPKVLHRINGKPLIRHLLESIRVLSLDKIIVVIGHKGELVEKELADFKVEFVWQREQLGTGHAVMMARENLRNFEGTILVAAGDVPFLSTKTMERLFETHEKAGASATCLSAVFDDPTGYGRIIRKDKGDILLDIIEEKDASPEVKDISEVNSGTFCFDRKDLFAALDEIDNKNAQAEYYLTDTIKILQARGKLCAVSKANNPLEVAGINSAEQLKALEDALK